jgi:thymidylate kinase
LSEECLIDDGCMSLTSTHVKASVARALISILSKECKAYCILSGYDGLPESFDSDIDFMVDQVDFQRMPGIILSLARQTNTLLFQSIDHEISARAFLLTSLSGPRLTIIQLDSASDYRHFGSLWLRAGEVLAARRLHRLGFWIPSAAHEFAYYLIKRLNKRSFSQQHGSRLHQLYKEDGEGCNRIIARFWKGSQRNVLRQMAVSGDWAKMPVTLESLRRELMRNTADSLPQKIASSPKRALHTLSRIARPTGGWIAFIGPDGSGKSLVIRDISQQFAPAFRDILHFHMRPKFLSRRPTVEVPVTNPHGQSPREFFVSIAKIFYYVADYFIGYVFHILPALIRTRLVIFDRYFYDLQVDSKRVRYGGPVWLLHLVARVVPSPDLVILLNAPAEVLWTRKQEVPFAEVKRQTAAYLKLAHDLPSAIVVNASQPIPDVIRDVIGVIVAHFSRRTAERLELQASPLPVVGVIEPETPNE